MKNEKVDSQSEKKNQGLRAIPFSIALVAVFAAGYLYVMNSVAVQGYAMRSAEKEIARLREENSRLRIEEAEVKSLARIEEAGRRLNMFESVQPSYIENSHSIALR